MGSLYRAEGGPSAGPANGEALRGGCIGMIAKGGLSAWPGGQAGRGRRKPVHGGLAAASMPQTPPPRLPTRPLTVPCTRPPPRERSENQDQKPILQTFTTPAVSTKVDTHQKQSVVPTARGNCRRRGGSGGRGVSRMGPGMPRAGWAGRPTPVLPCAQDGAHEQAATELTWTYLQRPLPPDPPRHPSGNQLLPLTWLWSRRVQGCKPCQHPHPAGVPVPCR